VFLTYNLLLPHTLSHSDRHAAVLNLNLHCEIARLFICGLFNDTVYGSQYVALFARQRQVALVQYLVCGGSCTNVCYLN